MTDRWDGCNKPRVLQTICWSFWILNAKSDNFQPPLFWRISSLTCGPLNKIQNQTLRNIKSQRILGLQKMQPANIYSGDCAVRRPQSVPGVLITTAAASWIMNFLSSHLRRGEPSSVWILTENLSVLQPPPPPSHPLWCLPTHRPAWILHRDKKKIVI